MKNIEAPKWTVWGHATKYTADEAAAITMNFCPNAVEKIRLEVVGSGSPALFGLVAGANGMSFEEAEEFEERLLLLKRKFDGMIAKTELIEFAQSVGWNLPHELASSAQSANKSLSDNERDKLLKHIGTLALQVASMSGNKDKYMHGGKLNVSGIASDLAAILDAIPDANRRGLGDSSLRQSITEGLRLLNR